MKHASLLLGTCLLLLCGCGDGGGDGGADGGSGALSDFEGTWIMRQCSQLGPNSAARLLITATIEPSGAVRLRQGARQYVTEDCSDTGVAPGSPTDAGTIVFGAGEGNAHLAIRRGVWTQPSSASTKVIWVREHGVRLCIVADTEPTAFPTEKSIEDYLDILDDDFCYERN